MCNSKRHNHKDLKFIKYFPIIFLFVIVFPSNYSGKRLTLRNGLQSPFTTKNNILDRPKPKTTDTAVVRVPKADDDPQNALKVTLYFIIFSILILITSTILISLILGYLNSVSIVKRCLLLYLYRDVLTILLFIQWLSFASVVTGYLNGNGITMDTSTAKDFAYCSTFLSLILLLTLNVMSALKLYMMKEMILDPPTPWHDEDNNDLDAIAKIRFTGILFDVFVVGSMYVFEAYPKVYYILIGDDRSLSALPIGASITEGFHLILFITYIITTIGTRIYQKTENSRVVSILPRQLHNLPLMFLITIAAMFFCAGYMNMFANGHLWIMVQLMLTVTGVLSPAWIISTTIPLRSYVQKTIGNATTSFMDMLHDYVPSNTCIRNCKQDSSQIEPII